MELLSSPSLSSYCSFACRQSTSTSKECSPSFFRISNRKTHFSIGLKLTSERLQPSNFIVEAVVGDATAVPNDPSTGYDSLNEETYPRANSENVDDLGDPKMDKICDKLIDVFMVDKPNPGDWRRLLAFSKEWDAIRPHFFKRCQNRADKENDPGMKHRLLRLGRKLKEVDEDVQRHNELLQIVKNAPSEIGDIVARRRKNFTKEFFMHLHAVAESYHDDEVEQNAIAKISNTCLAAVQAYDTATESIEAINAAELKFQDIINSPSVDAACRKIDNLAEKNQLDSALVLMITKAWSAAKETNMMKDEGVLMESTFLVAAILCGCVYIVILIIVACQSWLRPRLIADEGTKKEFLESLPKSSYDSANGSSSECAVCLGEYIDGDEIRVLPHRGHVFHVRCIDMWLGSHLSCPLCREIVVISN